MKQIRLLVVESNALGRLALQGALMGHPHIRIVGEAHDGDQAVPLYRYLKPDVVIMELNLPSGHGSETITTLRKESPPARILVLSQYAGSEDIYRAVKAGAMGYLTKDTTPDELIRAIANIDRDMRFLPRSVMDQLAERMPSAELTPRETEVLECIARGCSNREVAEELRIAEKTVRIHVSSLLDKMGARDRLQATLYALRRGMVHLNR